MKIFIEFLAVFCIICASVSMAMGGDDPANPLDQYATDPLNATYLIEGDQIFEGRVTIGHEVRSFLPCSYKKTLWLIGKWFFEGDFPIVLRASSGKVIATGYATAKDEWMTDNFVPFESEIKFKMPKPGSRGTLILKKDNPTDLPVHDDELEIVVYFAYQDSMSADPWQKITFDISKLDESGLHGPPDGKRALAYEFCVPDTVQHRTEVKRIDPTVKFFAQSPGRIGCGESENLCIGSTHQKDFRGVLQRLTELTYVQRIDESFFE